MCDAKDLKRNLRAFAMKKENATLSLLLDQVVTRDHGFLDAHNRDFG
jgi:hypothetical protein